MVFYSFKALEGMRVKAIFDKNSFLSILLIQKNIIKKHTNIIDKPARYI